jgi:uncharacterized protein (TIGR02246 family)
MDVRELADRELIRDVIHAYCRHVDRQEASSVAELFTDDATFVTTAGRHGTAVGRAAIQDRMTLLLSTFEATSHHVSNTAIRFADPDLADAETYLFAWHRFPGERPDGYLWARYIDRFVRDGDSWRIAERTLKVVGERDFPFAWVPYRSS